MKELEGERSELSRLRRENAEIADSLVRFQEEITSLRKVRARSGVGKSDFSRGKEFSFAKLKLREHEYQIKTLTQSLTHHAEVSDTSAPPR